MATKIIKGKAFKTLLDAKQVSPKAIQCFDDITMKLAEHIEASIDNKDRRITEDDVFTALRGVVRLEEDVPETPEF